MNDPMRILFVCARNLWRSPTAEQIYRNDPRVEARSAGVSHSSRRCISARDLEWADLVLVMERKHAKRILENFSTVELPTIESLDIPDDYQFGDTDLIELIRTATDPFLP